MGASMLEQENCMQYMRHVDKVDMHIFFRNRFLTTAVVWNKQILHTRTYTNTLIVWAVPFPFLVSVKGVFRKCGTRVPILSLLDCQQSNIWACGVFDTFETPSESAQGRIVRNRPSTAPNWSKVKTRHQLRVCGRCGTTVAKCKTHTHTAIQLRAWPCSLCVSSWACSSIHEIHSLILSEEVISMSAYVLV